MGVKDAMKSSGDDVAVTPEMKKILPLVEEFRTYFNWIGEELLVDMDIELRSVMLAMLAKQHVYFEGLHGTAKSKLANDVFNGITGADTFVTECTKKMSEEYFIGPLDMKLLKDEGKMRHLRDGKTILNAQFAYLDEFPDLPQLTQRALLGVLNERKFNRPWQQEKAKLHTAFATANYSDPDDLTAAVYDRFMIKVKVNDIGDSEDRIRMYKMYMEGKVPYKHTLSAGTVYKLSRVVRGDTKKLPTVQFPEMMLSLYDAMVLKFQDRFQTRLSDRRKAMTLDLIKASALLNDRLEVSLDDLDAARWGFVCCNDVDEETKFDHVYGEVTKEARERVRVGTEYSVVQQRFLKAKKKYDKVDGLTAKGKIGLGQEIQVIRMGLKNRPPITMSELSDYEIKYNDMERETEEMYSTLRSELFPDD